MERHDGVNANKLIGGTKNEELKDTLDDIVKQMILLMGRQSELICPGSPSPSSSR